MQTLRIVLRGLTRTPLMATVAILSLALGIGVNTAVFSLMDQILFRRLPVDRPEELVSLYSPGEWQGNMSSDESGGPSFSYPLFREMQAEMGKPESPLAGLAGARGQTVTLAYENQSGFGSARLVSGNYFELLGVHAALGRLFTPNDDATPGGHPVVVLTHNYWTNRFGANPAVLNQTLRVAGYPLTIVGIAEPGFRGERPESVPDIFVPISMKEQVTPDWGRQLTNRQNAWVTMFGRLKPGVSFAQAEGAINVPYRAQVEQDAQLLRNPRPGFLERFRQRKITLQSAEYGRGDMRREASTQIYLMFGITLMVLLIACANVANLQLARSATRIREVAVRLAVGASRWQLIRQLLTESSVLAVAGGVLGLVIGQWTLQAIVASIPPSEAVVFSTEMDSRVLLFNFVLAISAGFLFGLFPALQASRTDLVTSLKNQAGQVSGGGSANVFRKGLVTAQVAIALCLLVIGGLFTRTLMNLARVDLGIRVDHLMTFAVAPRMNGYTDQQAAQIYDQISAKVAAIPGVTVVSAARVPAIAGSTSTTTVEVEGYTSQGGDDSSNVNGVGAGYFRAVGMPLIAGREFTASDNLAGPRVAIVNEAFVRKFLPQQNPMGRHIGRGKDAREIVGVVANAKYANLREPVPATYYSPITQYTTWSQINFYARTAIPPENTAPLIQRAVAEVDANLPIRELKSMQQQIDQNVFAERIFSVLTASFAGLATVLAAIGLYGVLAFNIARRTREIGIRMAIGAGSRDVRRLVAREVALMMVVGTVAGVAAAVGGGKAAESMLFGLKPWDLAVYGSAVLLLWVVAIGAAIVPARRAVSVDPMIALRYE